MLIILDLGTLQIKIEAKTDEARRQLKGFGQDVREAERTNHTATKAISKAWGGVKTGIALAGKAVVGATASMAAGFASVTKNALDNYASYEQLAGGIEKLFGDSADIVKGYAQDAFKTAGMSANQYMDLATSFSASLISSLNGDTQKAAKYTNMAIKDMSDNANVFGTDIEMLKNAYQGFAKENYTMLDNLKLGYGGTKGEMERLIQTANKLRKEQGKTANLSINNLNDVILAIHTVQKDFKITGTTIKEASGTIEGSVNMLRASWDNWLTDLGNSEADVDKSTNNLVESFSAAASNVIPRIGIIATTLSEELPDAIDELGPVIDSAFQNIDIEGIMAGLMNSAADVIANFNPSEKVSVFLEQMKNALTGKGESSPVAEAGAKLANTLVTEFGKFVGNPDNWVSVLTIIGTMLNNAVDSAWNASIGRFTGVQLNNGEFSFGQPEQHAEGGVYTKPTLLGNGNHIVGEAGSEAIIPLTPDVLGQIGSAAAAYAATTNNNTTTVNNFYINDAVVNQDKEIESQFINLMNDIKRKGGM